LEKALYASFGGTLAQVHAEQLLEEVAVELEVHEALQVVRVVDVRIARVLADEGIRASTACSGLPAR
jgi:hypothetical protein